MNTKLLALETSHRAGSVALWDDGRVVAARPYRAGFREAAGLMSVVDELTRVAGWRPGELGRVAVSVGPGSFTGLRVGVTAAKMLGFALGVEVVAVPSLRVVAENAPADVGRLGVWLDARKGRVTAGTFEREGGRWRATAGPRLVPVADALMALPQPAALAGDGVAAHRQVLPPDAVVLPEELWVPRAEVVAALAASGAFPPTDPMRLAPAYCRQSEPEEKRAAQSGR